NEEQIRDWTLEQKDRWWFENVWKGDMPQLTIRSALTGMLLGGVLSLTNLYIGAKTGWSLGVGITSVILAFSLFKVLSSLRLSSEFTVLENNCMQSIATAAGYMTAPMTSSLAAYMMITGELVPIWQAMIWIIVLAIMGVLFAFPLKRRFINDEQHPFPEGRAAGVVMDSLHTSDAKEGILKGGLLAISGGFAATVAFLSSSLVEKIHLGFLHIPEKLDAWMYKIWSPKIADIDPRQMEIYATPEVAMFGAGGLMGIKVGVSLMVGCLVNYFILAPIMINRGDIEQYKDTRIEKQVFMELETQKQIVKNDAGAYVYKGSYKSAEQLQKEKVKAEKNPELLKKDEHLGKKNEKLVSSEVAPVKFYGFKGITFWSLWTGVAMMTAASLFAFFSKPKILITAFTGMFRRRKKKKSGDDDDEDGGDEDILKDIELPMSVFCIGIPFVGAIVVVLAHYIFGVAIWHGVIAIPLIFVFTLIGVNSTALTAITPTGALGKLTQLTYAGIAHGNKTTNIATASITGEVAGHASNLLMDIKPGYMLGAKPRQQAIGHVLGIFAGALASVPVFYYVFIHNDPANFNSGEYPFPSATIWKAVADILAEGISALKTSAVWGVGVGIAVGLGCEILKLLTKGKFWLSGVGVGLAMVLPFCDCLTMFSGALFFWLLGVIWKKPESWINRVLVKNTEAICAGLIAGGALMGILVKVLEALIG
ncbi:MAG: OPT/YSL family transporter, partial [Planctomycetia bacterium]